MDEKDIIKKLVEKYPQFKPEPIEEEKNEELESQLRKVVVTAEDIMLLLQFGEIDLEDEGITLVLKKTPKDDDFIQVKTIKPHGNSGRVIIPQEWMKKYRSVFIIPYEHKS